jgi:transcriptional regulator with GAF, ATPase, and Fis domain
MAAFAPQIDGSAGYYIRLESEIAESPAVHGFVLDALRLQVQFQTAVIYAVEPATTELIAVAARSTVAAEVQNVGVMLSAGVSEWMNFLAAPEQGSPTADQRFEKFPEALQYRLKTMIVAPLRTEKLLGLMTLGRRDETPFDESAVAPINQASRLLTAVLERDSLRRKLTERKLVERAKGIVQARKRLTEEQAYLLLRSTSRRRRVSMATIAAEIIDAFAPAIPSRSLRGTERVA